MRLYFSRMNGGYEVEPDCDGHKDDRQAGQWFVPLFVGGNANITGGRNGRSAAYEVMDLTYEMTRTLAEIYELIADVAGSLSGPPEGNLSIKHLLLQRQLATLRKITRAAQESERRIRLLESGVVGIPSVIFDAFLKDCSAASETFDGVSGDLAGIIELDGSTSPAVTATETLMRIMNRLKTCSGKVAGLPATGMAFSYRSLAETAFNLQCRTSDPVGKSSGSL